MTTRVAIARPVLDWAVTRSARNVDDLTKKFPKWHDWTDSQHGPTPAQLEKFAKYTGIPFGYLLLRKPPELGLPIADFREGHTGGWDEPSTALLAVLHQSIRRQDWYRAYAEENGLPALEIVGSANDKPISAVAADMRDRLKFQVDARTGSWNEIRKHLLLAFEALGGLTVAASMVGNNTHRPLDPAEFRGFSLVDPLAPLVFVNAAQTLNGQIFTLAHEYAHIWRGTSGISAEDVRRQPSTSVERWCNAVASEFLVPEQDLRSRYGGVAALPLDRRLDHLAGVYKCGTLVVLQAIHRADLVEFQDFDAVYDAEAARLATLAEGRKSTGGDHYRNQPYRVGDRLSKALIGEAVEGRTTVAEAMRLMSMKSLSNFDEYARRLGVA